MVSSFGSLEENSVNAITEKAKHMDMEELYKMMDFGKESG